MRLFLLPPCAHVQTFVLPMRFSRLEIGLLAISAPINTASYEVDEDDEETTPLPLAPGRHRHGPN